MSKSIRNLDDIILEASRTNNQNIVFLKTESKDSLKVHRGKYVDNESIKPYLLAGMLVRTSYLSFEYVLAKYNIIPERVNSFTSATVLKKHNNKITNCFGDFYYSDVPLKVFSYLVNIIKNGDNTYLEATKEKALCDLLYKEKPVYSIKSLKELLFNDLRVDKDEFLKLNFDDILSIALLYRKKNLNILYKYIKKEYKKWKQL